MKVKILVNDAEREVTIKGLKGKHRREFFRATSEMGKSAKEDESAALDQIGKFQDFWDKIIPEVSDLTNEEYEDLDLEEMNKLIVAVRDILLPFGSEPDF